MERRPDASHMDYEWQNKSGPLGPLDQASPFAMIGSQQQGDNLKKREAHGFKGIQRGFANLFSGSFGMLDSPAKNDNIPSLREPASSHNFLFSRPDSPIRSPQAYGSVFQSPSFTTPRKFDVEYPSSGLDTSPENNADSEATPDMSLRSAASKVTKVFDTITNGDKATKTLEDKKSKSNTGKGDLVKKNCYSNKAVKRIQKRQQDSGRRLWIARRHASFDSDSEDSSRGKGVKRRTGTSSTTEPGRVASLFGFIESHPNLPHILSYYAQLLLNFFLVLFFIYIVYSFWSTIRADVDKKSEEAVAEVVAEMAACAKDYRENSCDSERRAPALEAICNNWERCMARDPRSVGRAKVSAHTFAEIFNSFIEPISLKAMAFCLVIAVGCFAVSNIAFGLFRNKMEAHSFQAGSFATPHGPGNTPYRQGGEHWSQYQSPLSWEPHPSKAQILDAQQSPSRRLLYN